MPHSLPQKDLHIDAAGLRVMKAIADEGSFTAAATSLGFTQPAISQMVRRLEQRTGTDGWAMQVARMGVPTEVISVPLRHMPSAVATVAVADIDPTEPDRAAVDVVQPGEQLRKSGLAGP